MSEELLKSLTRRALSNPSNNIFECLEEEFEYYFYNLSSTSPLVTVSQFKKNKNKLKGELFEYLCLRLIFICSREQSGLHSLLRNTKRAWLLRDLPLALRTQLGIPKKDFGIDIVTENNAGQWIAIQCKYRQKPKKQRHTPQGFPIKHQVAYKDLSTFHSLCEQSGPWFARIVMTNCESTQHVTKQERKHISICRGSFGNLERLIWDKLAGDPGHILGSHVTEAPPSREKDEKKEKDPAQQSTDALDARIKNQAFLDRLAAKDSQA